MNVLLEKSLMNCHCIGLDSLVLKDGPQMIRIFVARREHQLFLNKPWESGRPMAIGLHRHHCDVTLMRLLGDPENVEICWGPQDLQGWKVTLYSYTFASHVLSGEGAGFTELDRWPIAMPLTSKPLDFPRFMRANELHSVYVPAGKVAAWMVWEGEESDDHQGIVYTNDPHQQNFDFDQLDLPMTPERLAEDMALLGIQRYPTQEVGDGRKDD